MKPKLIAQICIWVAVASLVVGIISRMSLTPVTAAGLESRAFAGFGALMLLFSIAVSLVKKD